MANCKDCVHVEVCCEKNLHGKLGDEIFCTTRGKIYQGVVGRIELDDEGVAIITTDGYCHVSHAPSRLVR